MLARSQHLGIKVTTWVRAVIADALRSDRRREIDAAVAAQVHAAQLAAPASQDARELAAQIRPLALNVNDLDRRARSGEVVTLSDDVPELIALLREIRTLLGDRVAS